jgi:hypothetical protein
MRVCATSALGFWIGKRKTRKELLTGNAIRKAKDQATKRPEKKKECGGVLSGTATERFVMYFKKLFLMVFVSFLINETKTKKIREIITNQVSL